MRTDILNRRDEILSWIEQGVPLCDFSKLLRCHRVTVKKKKKKMGIEYHGNQGLKGMGERKNIQNRKTVSELLLTKSTTSSKIRLRLIKEGYKEEKCEICGLTEWMGKPIPLELHHKDFNHHNNDIENLQILCSNCHMQIHNYNNIKPPVAQ